MLLKSVLFSFLLVSCYAEYKDCGRAEPRVLGGETVVRGELPWHVGVYRKLKTGITYLCGGTIVSNKAVISGAICFWDDSRNMQYPASDYAVAAGKLHRMWDHEADASAQKSEVKEVFIPDLFRGSATNYQEDISVVRLATPFVYTDFVRPICLSFDEEFNEKLMIGKIGKTGGWGLTSANGELADILKVVQLPHVSVRGCIASVSSSFTKYITSDKFCAGYTNGTAFLCSGDGGGGLVYSAQVEGAEQYYLMGVTSVAPESLYDKCNTNTVLTFTDVIKHKYFIKKNI